MHVERIMQQQLIDIIAVASQANESRLILVCGSVGDGKSHLLSYLRCTYPDMMNQFYLHNDASESLDPTKTSMDVLNEVLDGFSDEKLGNGEVHKVIIAINLGTLNNFIESSYQSRFTQLKTFVKHHKIVETGIENQQVPTDSYFNYINFTDYHLYTLTEKGPKSSYLDQLLMKIVNHDEDNELYLGYCRSCEQCIYNGTCPIQANYELLQYQSIRKGVIDHLIKAMIKEKLIISTRDVLNFFYDAITGGMTVGELFKLNASKQNEDKLIKQIKLLIFHNIFEGKERSHVLDQLSLIDPLQYMSEKDKDKMVAYQLSNDICSSLKEDMKEFNNSFIKYELESMGQIVLENRDMQGASIQKLKKLAYECYKRSEIFRGIIDQDEIYVQYMKDLYYRNRGSKRQLVTIFKEVKAAVYKWDGSTESEGIRILSSKRHKDLGIYEPIVIKPYVKQLEDNEQDELDRFLPYLGISFVREGSEHPIRLDMDYNLYLLIKHLNEGYLNNEEEYRKNIAFQGFIEKLLSEQNQEEKELVFEDTSNGELTKYKLVYNTEFEYYEFRVI